jgi:wyosine [tRNA(Phe)-imidazoG37] synthetase (radical SAM superfamily)
VESILPTLSEILKAVEEAILDMDSPPTNLTFSGNGEPTLHPDLVDIVDGVIAIRDRLCPSTRTAILSNASTLGEPAVMKAVSKLDDPIMKLDAGDDPVFKRYNQPGISIAFQEIIGCIGNLETVVIQCLFTAGDAGNFTPSNIANWVEKIRLISPRFVQIYSLARGFPSKEIISVPKESLEEIKAELTRSGIAAEVY